MGITTVLLMHSQTLSHTRKLNPELRNSPLANPKFSPGWEFPPCWEPLKKTILAMKDEGTKFFARWNSAKNWPNTAVSSAIPASFLLRVRDRRNSLSCAQGIYSFCFALPRNRALVAKQELQRLRRIFLCAVCAKALWYHGAACNTGAVARCKAHSEPGNKVNVAHSRWLQTVFRNGQFQATPHPVHSRILSWWIIYSVSRTCQSKFDIRREIGNGG